MELHYYMTNNDFVNFIDYFQIRIVISKTTSIQNNTTKMVINALYPIEISTRRKKKICLNIAPTS